MARADIRPASPAMMPNPNGVPTSAAAMVVPAHAAYPPAAAPTSHGLRTRVARPKPSMPSGMPIARGSTTPRLVSGLTSSRWTATAPTSRHPAQVRNATQPTAPSRNTRLAPGRSRSVSAARAPAADGAAITG